MLTSSQFGVGATALDGGSAFGNAETVQEYVQDYFSDVPVMIAIAGCESHFRHVDKNGNIIRGEVNPDDIGVMQINEHYHGAKAKSAGIDLYTLQGNLAYARLLYEDKGTAPWSASKGCWGDKVLAKR